jgi:L-threonylcarbamoyladenylate synthase
LQAGGVIAYPTEAVYGLGCDPRNQAAFSRLLALKGRPEAKGVILIAADEAQLTPYMAPLPDAILARLRRSWPGPVTWIVPAAVGTPAWLTGGRDTIAVRVTAHPPAAALCRAFGGALVSTSANRSDQPPARTKAELQRIFGDALDMIVPGPLGGLTQPTRICDARTGAIIRQ